jgi:NAD(P)-dependent dehydrogenase (short-subunit alcohol dehydrogenase family)
VSEFFSETATPKNYLVVGASGGIGLGFVQHFLTQPYFLQGPNQLVATYRRWSPALAELQTQFPQHLQCWPLDITQEAQIADLAANLHSLPALHGVINCVGLLHDEHLQPEKSLRHLNSENLQRYFAVNSIGPVLLAKYLLPLLRHGEPSLFATLSAKVGSIGDNALGGWYGYRASKAALNMFLRTTAIEYQRVAPRVVMVLLHPGTTATALSRPFQKNVPPDKLFAVKRTVAQLIQVLAPLTPADSGSFLAWDGSRLPW